MTKQRKRYYSIRSFLSFMAEHKLHFGITMFLFGVADTLLAVIPIYIGKLVGALSAHPVQGHQAVIYTWVLIGLSTGHNVIWRVAEYFYTKYITPLSFEYEGMLFRHTIRKPYY